MNRRVLSYILGALGVVLVIAGLVVMLAVAPAMKQLPADTDVTRTYSGQITTLLDPTTFRFLNDTPMTITRTVKVTGTDGQLAQVREQQAMQAGGKTIQSATYTYVVDRKTMLSVPDDQVPADWRGADGYWPREGIVFGWPIDTERKDYPGWSEDYRDTVTLKYEGEEEHAGSMLLHFTAGSAARPIDSAHAEQLGLPPAVPKQALLALLSQADFGALGGIIGNRLPALLDAWPQATVPLEYYYEYQGNYWVDPVTGVLVDTDKHELRKAGLGEDVIKGSVLAALPEAQRAMLRVAVSDYTYEQSAASVKEAAADASDAGSRLDTLGTILPWLLIGIGAALVVAAVALLMVRREGAGDATGAG